MRAWLARESSSPSTTAPAGPAAPAGNQCPQAVDISKADFYPIQPSFSAGYEVWVQKLTSDTASWAYEVTADFPYSNWTAWYLYSLKGVPLFKYDDDKLLADAGSTNPFVQGAKILAAPRHFHIYFMPATTPANVVAQMQAQGKNVALLPAVGSTPAVAIVSRSYWSFVNDGLGNYNRLGYGGPTDTPFPEIQAFLTDTQTGALTSTPVSDCAAQSELPQKLWYDASTQKPVVTFEHAPRPTDRSLPTCRTSSCRRDRVLAPWVPNSHRRRCRRRCSSTATSPPTRPTPTCSRHRLRATRPTLAAGT